jgi:hypothetical protein
MHTTTALSGARRELARRQADGIAVSLLWDERDDRLTVAVADARTGDAFVLDATRDDALDVFYHPYPHAARRGVPFTDTLLAA